MTPEECGDYHHEPLIFSQRRAKDLFVKTYWVYCRHCDLILGPYPQGFAFIVVLRLDAGVNDTRPECNRYAC